MKIDADIVLIAGPTASGKTRLAIDIARANGALVLNADSMQVYRELRILSARPSPEEEARAPHHLFGHVGGDEAYSVARWVEDVKPYLETGRNLVIVGGTGLYFNTLLNGLSPIPETPGDVRRKWRDAGEVPTGELHRQLDPQAAAVLNPGDRQRIIRALEVHESTGRSIIEWQKTAGKPVLPSEANIARLLLMPDRKILHERINRRFELMVEEGAIDEVSSLLALNYPSGAPVMKAIGVPQLAGYLDRELSLEEALEKGKAATRQYAKRQSTWFRNSFGEGWKHV